MYKIICFLVAIGAAMAQGKVQWSLCGQSVLLINNFDLGTMPILNPGPMPFILSGKSIREIRGAVKTDVKIARTTAGITLPISCLLANGNYVGSCVYPDLCQFINNFFGYDQSNCPQNLIENDIDCTCPFKIRARSFDIDTIVDLPDISKNPNPIISFGFSSGSFDVTIRASDAIGVVSCMNLKFSVKPQLRK